MTSLKDRLENMAEEVDEKKRLRAEAQGSLNQQMEALKEFEVSSIEEGEKKLAEWGGQLEKDEAALEDELDKLVEETGWSV